MNILRFTVTSVDQVIQGGILSLPMDTCDGGLQGKCADTVCQMASNMGYTGPRDSLTSVVSYATVTTPILSAVRLVPTCDGCHLYFSSFLFFSSLVHGYIQCMGVGTYSICHIHRMYTCWHIACN